VQDLLDQKDHRGLAVLMEPQDQKDRKDQAGLMGLQDRKDLLDLELLLMQRHLVHLVKAIYGMIQTMAIPISMLTLVGLTVILALLDPKDPRARKV
jgi:hypothetical protein